MASANRNKPQIEAIARDYSELHIDIMASVANDVNGPSTPVTPATFDDMVSPKERRPSRVRSKFHKFSIRKLFGKKQDGPPSSRSNPAKSPIFPTSPSESNSSPRNSQPTPVEPPSPTTTPPSPPSAAPADN